MKKHFRSEIGFKVLAVISLFLAISMMLLIYETNRVMTDFSQYIGQQTREVSDGEHKANLDHFKNLVTKGQSRLFSGGIIVFLGLTLIALLFSMKYGLHYEDDEEQTGIDMNIDYLLSEVDETDVGDVDDSHDLFPVSTDMAEEEYGIYDENDLDNDFPENFMLDNGENEVVLAQSYGKMVEALQKINELEKKHSVELAEGNKKLEDVNRKLGNEITERKRAEKEIRHLSRKLISGIEEAQKNLAQDLHDEFGQTLAALHMGVETLCNSIPDEMVSQKKNTENLIGLIEQLGDKIRSISSDLRPDLLDDLGLVPTLEWYIHEYGEQNMDVDIEFQAVGFKKRISPEKELIIYRIVQESLNNIVKHAKACKISVMLTYSYPKVIFMIRDDGIGFDQNVRSGGIGLIGMRERTASVNGKIEIRSGKGKGTTIRGELPVS